jgi:hypothetical protein
MLSGARVWKNEATNTPDASKAYAVLRVLKAIAVAYDILYERLQEAERHEVRDTLVAVGRAYFAFFQEVTTAGEGYNKHHGSVDAPPLGIVALTLLGELPEAERWLELMIEKHTAYLLPFALTPSGTNEQSSNFWASTLQYRIFFLDALRRVTGRDLFAEHPNALPGGIALAAVAGLHPSDLRHNEANRSVLFGPSYGQLDYWSPVLLFLAREKRRPLFQYLALWDGSLGKLQRTRYVTPTRSEELLEVIAQRERGVAAVFILGLEHEQCLRLPERQARVVLEASDTHTGAVHCCPKAGVEVHEVKPLAVVDNLSMSLRDAGFGKRDVSLRVAPQDDAIRAQDVALRRGRSQRDAPKASRASATADGAVWAAATAREASNVVAATAPLAGGVEAAEEARRAAAQTSETITAVEAAEEALRAAQAATAANSRPGADAEAASALAAAQQTATTAATAVHASTASTAAEAAAQATQATECP